VWRSNGILLGTAEALLIVALGAPACPAGEPPKGTASVPPAARGPAAEAEKSANSVNLRPIFDAWGLDAHVQGKRGTCSAFVMTEAIEYAVASRQRRATRLSVEFLNWASNQATKTHEDGGFFSDLWKGYAAYGVCPEEDLPYLDHFDPNLQPSQKALARAKKIQALGLELHWIKEWDPKKGLTGEQLAEIQRTLQRRWPVCGGFLWPKREQWADGVLEMCPRDAVRDGHSVLLVGFRDDPAEPGGGVFLIRNSSGKSRDGLMSYEYVQTYMNDAVWVGRNRGAGGGAPDGAPLPMRPAGRGTNDGARAASLDLLLRDPLGALTAGPGFTGRSIGSSSTVSRPTPRISTPNTARNTRR